MYVTNSSSSRPATSLRTRAACVVRARHRRKLSRSAYTRSIQELTNTAHRYELELTCQSINQSIKVICNARNVVHKLESEARAVASGRALMVIEKVGLEASLKVFSVPDSRIVSGISFHTVGAACRKARAG